MVFNPFSRYGFGPEQNFNFGLPAATTNPTDVSPLTTSVPTQLLPQGVLQAAASGGREASDPGKQFKDMTDQEIGQAGLDRHRAEGMMGFGLPDTWEGAALSAMPGSTIVKGLAQMAQSLTKNEFEGQLQAHANAIMDGMMDPETGMPITGQYNFAAPGFFGRTAASWGSGGYGASSPGNEGLGPHNATPDAPQGQYSLDEIGRALDGIFGGNPSDASGGGYGSMGDGAKTGSPGNDDSGYGGYA